MKKNIEKEVHRVMNNMCTNSSYSGTLKTEEVDFWLENFSDLLFCYGKMFRAVFTKLTENNYKVTREWI